MQASARRLSFALLQTLHAAASRVCAPSPAAVLTGMLSLCWPIAGAGAQTPEQAQPPTAWQQQVLRTTLNGTSLIIATGGPHSSYLAMADDIAAALGKTAEVRLVPIASKGGIENLRDLVFLRGVDLAIVPANVLAQPKAMESQLGAGLQQRLAYVTHLYAEEVHLLVGGGVGSLEGLRGKKIALLPNDGTAEFTARDLLAGLGVEIVRQRPTEAIAQVRSGALAGALLVGGKPLQVVSDLPKDGRLRLLALPFSKPLEQGYLPAVLRAEDYPSLIPGGHTVETVAVSAVLMANTARGYEESTRRLAKFVPVFFSAVADLSLPGGKAKWRELNLAAPLAGWTRLPAAEEWLRNAKQQQMATLQKGFDEFLRSTRPAGSPELTQSQRKKLFDEFVDWTRQSVGAAREPARP